MADLTDLIRDASKTYLDFHDEHPVLSLILELAPVLLSAVLMDIEAHNNESDQEPVDIRAHDSGSDQEPVDIEANDSGSDQEPVDLDALSEKNRKEREELEEKFHATISEKLQDSLEKLTFLETQAHQHLLSSDFLHQLQEARALFDELNGLSHSEREQNADRITRLHLCIADLHAEYIQIETPWNHARSEWHTRWNQVQNLVQQGQAYPLQVDTSEGRETVTIDCDFWSRGALSEAGNTLPPLEQPEDTPIGTFNALSRQADQLYQRIVSIIQQACQDFVHSQMRIQLGNSIFEGLYSRGWYLEEESDFGFANDDQREELRLKLLSPVGDQLEFGLKPDNTLQMQPKFKNVHNRSLQQMLAQVLQSALQSNGITIQNVSL